MPALFSSKQIPVLKHINELRVDAQNANATPPPCPFLLLFTLFISKHHTSLYIVAKQK